MDGIAKAPPLMSNLLYSFLSPICSFFFSYNTWRSETNIIEIFFLYLSTSSLGFPISRLFYSLTHLLHYSCFLSFVFFLFLFVSSIQEYSYSPTVILITFFLRILLFSSQFTPFTRFSFTFWRSCFHEFYFYSFLQIYFQFFPSFLPFLYNLP